MLSGPGFFKVALGDSYCKDVKGIEGEAARIVTFAIRNSMVLENIHSEKISNKEMGELRKDWNGRLTEVLKLREAHPELYELFFKKNLDEFEAALPKDENEQAEMCIEILKMSRRVGEYYEE